MHMSMWYENYCFILIIEENKSTCVIVPNPKNRERGCDGLTINVKFCHFIMNGPLLSIEDP